MYNIFDQDVRSELRPVNALTTATSGYFYDTIDDTFCFGAIYTNKPLNLSFEATMEDLTTHTQKTYKDIERFKYIDITTLFGIKCLIIKHTPTGEITVPDNVILILEHDDRYVIDIHNPTKEMITSLKKFTQLKDGKYVSDFSRYKPRVTLRQELIIELALMDVEYHAQVHNRDRPIPNFINRGM